MDKVKRKSDEKRFEIKIKRGYILTASVCMLIAVSSIFASARSEEEILKDIISARTDILNDFYSGRIEKEEAIERITAIEGDNLLQEDIENIEKYFRTDIERIKKYSFKNIVVTKSKENMICADVTMTWDTEGTGGEESYESMYDVICYKEEKSYKLVQFF